MIFFIYYDTMTFIKGGIFFMKKQMSQRYKLLCGLLFLVLILGSCGTKKEVVTLDLGQSNLDDSTDADTAQDNTNTPEAENSATLELQLYFSNETSDGFETQTVYVDQLSAENILEKLCEKNMVSADTVANSMEFVEEDGQTKILLDLSETFNEYLVKAGSSKESLLMGSLVNTFLTAYEADSILVTIEGQILETGSFVYKEPLEFYNTVLAAKPLDYSIENVEIENEIQKITYPKILTVEGKKAIPDLENWNLRIEEFAFGDFSSEGMVSLNVTYEVATQTEKLLSIVIRGECYYEGAAYPYRFLKTVNVNVETGESIRLNQYEDPDALMQVLWSGIGFRVLSDSITKQDLATYLEQSVAADFAIEMFDYDYDSGNPALLPAGYSYQKDGKTVLVMPVIHAMGDYLEIMFE